MELPLRVAIVGAGGIGGLLGARLANAGQRAGFLVRRERVRELREAGLRIAAPDGELRLADPVVSDRPGELGEADVVALCTKCYDLEETAAAVAPIVRDGTIVVTLQNGVEAESLVRRGLARGIVLPGLAWVVTTRIGPGVIRQTSRFFRLTFGSTHGETSDVAKRFETACRRAGIEATLAQADTGGGGIVVPLWTKFLFIASVSAVTCTTNQRVGAVRATPEGREKLAQAMREVAAVGRAHGVAIPADAVEQAMAVFSSLPPEATSSMHEDLLAGRRLEIDHLSGAVVRLGRERGVETPIHAAACELLAAAKRGRGATSSPSP